MEIQNEVFGELTYDYTGSKKETVVFFGKSVQIVLLIAGDEDGEFEKSQYEAYEMFKTKWTEIQERLVEAILKYYREKRQELGYDVEDNESYPELLTEKELVEHLTLVGIKVPYGESYGGRSVGVSFDCTWDDENGIGVRLNDEKVVRVGCQDVAI